MAGAVILTTGPLRLLRIRCGAAAPGAEAKPKVHRPNGYAIAPTVAGSVEAVQHLLLLHRDRIRKPTRQMNRRRRPQSGACSTKDSQSERRKLLSASPKLIVSCGKSRSPQYLRIAFCSSANKFSKQGVRPCKPCPCKNRRIITVIGFMHESSSGGGYF